MSRDLVTCYCHGDCRQFQHQPCEFYQPDDHTCRLLCEGELNRILEQGRCAPYEILKRAVAKHLDKYRDVVDPSDNLDALTFEIAVRLRPQRLTQGFELYVLQGYINRAAYCGVIEMLQREHPFTKRVCGACRYLSLTRPPLCQRVMLVNNTAGEYPNPYYDQPRNLTDRACQDGFDALETTSLEDIAERPHVSATSMPDDSKLLLDDMFTLLSRRPAQQTDPRLKRRYERQYVIFCRFLDLLNEGYLHQEAMDVIAAESGVSLKTIQREITDIREFFRQEGVP